MRIPSVLFFCLLPFATIAEYDESSTRKINLEDIEDDHIKNERQSQSMPPPLSKQPAKGQPVQLYPPLSNEAYPIPSLFNVHHYSTRAHHHSAHVQPLTDQPTAPAPTPSEAGYHHQQLPSAYRGEEIVYIPAEGQHQSPHNPQQLYDVGGVGSVEQQQPSPHFYYSHDLPPHQHPTAGSGNAHENEYQLQFIPIEQHGGSAEQQQQQQHQHHHQLQHSYHGPSPVIVPSTAAPVEPVSYSHDMTYDGVLQPEMHPHPSYNHQHQHEQQQQQEPAQYQINNGIRESNAQQHVYGLPPDVLFQSQKDIEYAKPAENYGPPPLEYFKKEPYSQRDFSQDNTAPKTRTTPESSYQGETSYSDQIKSIDYQSGPSHQLDSSSSNSQTSYRQKVKAHESALSYGYDNQVDQLSKSTTEPKTYFSKQQTDFKYNQASSAEENKIPAISDGYQDFPAPSAPSETQTYYLNHLKAIKAVHHAESVSKPAIIYGPPDTIGKEPQIEYGAPDAPFRRPVAQSNQDVYAPRRPSSAGRSYGKSFAVSFPYPPSFVSFTTEKSSAVATGKSLKDFDSSANNDVNPWRPIVSPLPKTQYRSFGQISESTDSHQPIPDFFHTRRAKSLLDSYIPSWLVARMQEQHARQGLESPSTQAEDAYNTISYSSQENVNGNHFKRSIPKKKDHQKKKVQASNEEMTAME
ncbi:RNA-binding protein 33 [Eupeodes corollae]|uniref:RNA-binding protein 33 n=1 Tax=Eupeodes corollae TaxID=290404 RepID=UPI002493B2F4|nr:RNA-binding protein 33 [Eupeodes corollae]